MTDQYTDREPEGAGWFADPQDPTQQRYWDGTAWTEHRVPASAPTGTSPAPPSSSGATTSLILGILSLLLCGLLTGIPAMVTARRATKEIDASQGRIGGRGLATAGFVTGLIGTVWSVLAIGLVAFVFLFGAAVESSFEDTCTTVDSTGATAPC